MEKFADDLPPHAFQVMQQTLDLMGKCFPDSKRSDLTKVFVESYFNPPEDLK